MSPYLRSLAGRTVATYELEKAIMVVSGVSLERAKSEIVTLVYDSVLYPSADWSTMRVN